MAQSLFYRLFGIGKLPRKQLPVLEEEGIVLMDEGLPGSLTLLNLRAPGRRHGYRRSFVIGSVVITGLRLAAFTGNRPVVNLPIEGDLIEKLRVSVDKERTLVVEFDAEDFMEETSGQITLRLATDKARLFLDHLT